MIRPENTDFIRGVLASDVLTFTRYFFKAQYGRKFIVGKHHVAIANALGEVLRGECTRLIVNVPPRYGKTELVVKNFIAMGLALNPASKFLHLSYSAALAEDNSVAVKDILNLDAYKRLFPATRIKEGADTKTKWATTAGGGVYATSTLGQITGFGAGIVDSESNGYQFGGAVIIDDPIKPEDALSDLQRGNVNRRFETTIRNRVNSRNTPFIIIMQRLHADDLCGYLQKNESGVWKTITLPALGDDGQPLWEFKHTAQELQDLRDINPFVFDTQYQQHPTPMEGLMYAPERWREYDEVPITATRVVKNYTDTADTGADDLVSINYVETERGNYIIDLLCTQSAMEETEPLVARMLARDGVEIANIESNNGGRGFARAVEQQLRTLGNNNTRVEWFHQSANKEARIFTQAAAVQNLTWWPRGWRSLYPRAASQLDGFMRVGKNAHDDVADALTGTIEKRAPTGIQTYTGEIDGERVNVFFARGEEQAFVSAVLSDGKCYIAKAKKRTSWDKRGQHGTSGDNTGQTPNGKDAVQNDASAAHRNIFVGGQEELPLYNALRAQYGNLYAVPLPNVGAVEQWRGVYNRFLWNANDAETLSFANNANEPLPNNYSLCISVLAAAVIKDITA